MKRLSVWFGEKNREEREAKRGERACRQTNEAAIPLSCNYLAEHLSVRSLSVNQFRACSVWKQSEMGRQCNCPFWKKSLISGKRILNTVPVLGVSRNKTKCKTFVVKMSFICIIIESHFHINGFALSLVLKVRFFGTRKWPIVTIRLWAYAVETVVLPWLFSRQMEIDQCEVTHWKGGTDSEKFSLPLV